MRIVFSFALLFSSLSALANEPCAALMELSQTTPSHLLERERFEKTATEFCADSSDAHFRFLKEAFGREEFVKADIALRICEKTKTMRPAAFEEYLSSVSPKGVATYKECRAQYEDVEYSLNPSTVLESEFNLMVTDKKGGTTFHAITSKDAKCAWQPGLESPTFVTEGPTSMILNCTRGDAQKAASITLTRQFGDNPHAISFHWSANTLRNDGGNAKYEIELRRNGERLAAGTFGEPAAKKVKVYTKPKDDNTTTLVVRSPNLYAEVWIDGERVGFPPLQTDATVGLHRVELRVDGQQVRSKVVQLRKNEASKLRF